MKKLTFWLIITLSVLSAAAAPKKHFEPQPIKLNAGGTNIEVTFLNPQIVRVVKYHAALNQAPLHNSYSVTITPSPVQLSFNEASQTLRSSLPQLTASSNMLSVSINRITGRISFINAQGDTLCQEVGQTTINPISQGVNKGLYSIGEQWKIDDNEQIFGLGQRRVEAMSQRGQKVELWNNNTRIYIPYFCSQKGYGIYWDNSGRTFYNNQDDNGATSNIVSFSSTVGSCVCYYFMYGGSDANRMDALTAQIHQLSGAPTMFPLWTMGFWQCRERYRTPDELAGVLDEYRKRNVPLDGIVQDWQYWGCDSNWNSMAFQNPHYLNKIGDAAQMKYLPYDENAQKEIEKIKSQGEPRLKNPQQMVDYVHANNAHLMISIWPDFGSWTPQYAELKKINALYPFDTWPRNRGVLVYDAFNPAARDIYWKYLTNLYSMGFDAWWTDSTEPDHFEKPEDYDYMTHDGSWESVKNAFPLVTNRGIYEHQRKMKGNNKRQFQMTRSGAFGIQHYGTLCWSGDVSSSWAEMKNQIPSGLNLMICGIPVWNTDLGGFFCWDYKNDPKNPYGQELNVRWLQWGTFMPLMRSHCSSPMVTEIYQYGEPGDWAYDAMKEAIELRYAILPYTYSLLGATVQKSELMMRPLVMDFADDPEAIKLNTEYMFGKSFLVKPVTDPLYTWQDERKAGHTIYPDTKKAAAPVDIYLPKGAKWYNFWTNQLSNGGRTLKVLSPINQMPVFVKAGSIVPFGPKVQYAAEKKWDNLEIRVYPGADAEFTLYEDAGDGYEYEKGEFSTIEFSWNQEQSTLTVADRKGKFKGMLAQRKFTVKLAGTDKVQTIDYNGVAVSVKL